MNNNQNQEYNRNIVIEIGNHIAQRDKNLAEIWFIKAQGYTNLSVIEQINLLILQYRPVIMNISGVNKDAIGVLKTSYFSDEWIADFKQHVVPILIKYGIA